MFSLLIKKLIKQFSGKLCLSKC